MKRIVLFMIVTTVFLHSGYAQNILVANNNPGAATGINVYTGANAIRDAEAAAVIGDIIYVVPSPLSYGDLTISKELTVYGIGIRPTKSISSKSLLDLVDINASNVRLSGLTLLDDTQLGLTLTNTTIANTIIENCRVARIEMGPANNVTVNNLTIRNNIFTGNGSVAHHLLLYITSGVTITSNLFIGGGSVNSSRVTGADITYNIFAGSGNTGLDAGLQNNNFDHNIFYGRRVGLVPTSINNTWTYNLSFGSITMVFGTGASSNGLISDNIEDSDPMFINLPITGTWSDDYDFGLMLGSPALSSDPLNTSAEDIGTTGGPTPFDFEGNLLPLIQSIALPSTIPVGTDLPVTIKAKGN